MHRKQIVPKNSNDSKHNTVVQLTLYENWNLSRMDRKPGRPRKNWQDTIRRDLKDIGLSWNEVSELAHCRSS